MDRAQKEAKVADMHQSFQGAELMVVTHQSGMTVEESTDLRRQMRAAGASFRVTKNRLARIALKGTKFENLDGLFTGPTAVAFSEDPVAAARFSRRTPTARSSMRSSTRSTARRTPPTWRSSRATSTTC